MDIQYRTYSSARWMISFILLFVLQPVTLSAQTNETLISNENPAAAQQAAADTLAQGRELEKGGQWADALSLYQQAIKTYPKNTKLIEKRTIARIHYDLQRRYSDKSFRKTLASSSTTESLNVYSEVLLKIQSYYVDQPEWARLASFGLHSLEVALRSPEFRNINIPNVSEQEIRSAIGKIRQEMNGKTIGSRHDAYLVTSTVAERMQKFIGLPAQSTVYEFTNGAIAALDPYSAFMSDSQYGEAMSQIEGNFVGLVWNCERMKTIWKSLA